MGARRATITRPPRAVWEGARKMCRVHGSVIDRSGRACPNAKVEIHSDSSLQDRPEMTLDADDEGRFVVLLPLLEPHDLTATAPGLVTLRPIRFGFTPCSMFTLSDMETRDDNI